VIPPPLEFLQRRCSLTDTFANRTRWFSDVWSDAKADSFAIFSLTLLARSCGRRQCAQKNIIDRTIDTFDCPFAPPLLFQKSFC